MGNRGTDNILPPSIINKGHDVANARDRRPRGGPRSATQEMMHPLARKLFREHSSRVWINGASRPSSYIRIHGQPQVLAKMRLRKNKVYCISRTLRTARRFLHFSGINFCNKRETGAQRKCVGVTGIILAVRRILPCRHNQRVQRLYCREYFRKVMYSYFL